MSLEIEMIRSLQTTFSGPAGQVFINFCARWLIFIFVFIAAAMGVRKRQEKSVRDALFEAAWSALVALLIATVLSRLIGRLRPFLIVPGDVLLLIPRPLFVFAFPSGHTSVAFAVASSLLFGRRIWGVVSLIAAGLIAFGRVAAGVHYPSDVLAGVAVGVIAFGLVCFFHGFLRRRGKQLKLDLESRVV